MSSFLPFTQIITVIFFPPTVADKVAQLMGLNSAKLWKGITRPRGKALQCRTRDLASTRVFSEATDGHCRLPSGTTTTGTVSADHAVSAMPLSLAESAALSEVRHEARTRRPSPLRE